jgi:hypothetical protein
MASQRKVPSVRSKVCLTCLALLVLASPAASAQPLTASSVRVYPNRVEGGDDRRFQLILPKGCEGGATSRVVIFAPTRFSFVRSSAPSPWSSTMTSSASTMTSQVIFDATTPVPPSETLTFYVEATVPNIATRSFFRIVQYCGRTKRSWVSGDPRSPKAAPMVMVRAARPSKGR